MPIVINEIVIKTNVEQPASSSESAVSNASNEIATDEIVRKAVEKVMEILEEKKQR